MCDSRKRVGPMTLNVYNIVIVFKSIYWCQTPKPFTRDRFFFFLIVTPASMMMYERRTRRGGFVGVVTSWNFHPFIIIKVNSIRNYCGVFTTIANKQWQETEKMKIAFPPPRLPIHRVQLDPSHAQNSSRHSRCPLMKSLLLLLLHGVA